MFKCFVVLAAVAAVQARPQFPNLQFPQFARFPSTANGESNAQIQQGQSTDPFGNSNTILSNQAATGGRVQGFGSSSTGNAFGNLQQSQGLLGNREQANTGANSQQSTNGGFQFPVIPGLNPQAFGNAGATHTVGETVGIDGSRSKVESLSSQAGGGATDGGSNTSGAQAGSSSTDGLFGSDRQSNTNAQSAQTTGR